MIRALVDARLHSRNGIFLFRALSKIKPDVTNGHIER